MRIAEHVDVLAPPSIVWEQVSDPSRVLDFFAGVTRWECVGGPRPGSARATGCSCGSGRRRSAG